MSQTVTLEIPERSYRKLTNLAERRGQSPEALVTDTIEQMEDPTTWDRAVARQWTAELEDRREDIYTMSDGVAVNATR